MSQSLVPADRVVPWTSRLKLAALLLPLKTAISVNDGVLPESTDPGRALHYVDIGSVDPNGRILGVEELTFAAAPSRARRVPTRGDTIVSTVRTYLRAVAYIDTDDADLVCSTGFAVVRSQGTLLPRYLYYWLRSDLMIDEICARSVGVSYPAFNASELGSLPYPDLAKAEQQRIADFLDRKTAVIDELIARKERLVALLAEKRQALITQLVAKGLDRSAPMKDSGVHWLGGVPAHWTLKRLKHISPSQTVGVVVNPSSYYADEGLPFIFGGNVREGTIDISGVRRIAPEHDVALAKSRLHADDLVVVRVGYPGVAAVVPPTLEGANCASVMIVRRGTFDSRWLCYALNSRVGRYQVELVQYGAAQEQFNISHAVEWRFPVPPHAEQVRIADAIDERTSVMTGAASRTETSIDRLREYRQALITAAVSGQLDVTDERAVGVYDDRVVEAGA